MLACHECLVVTPDFFLYGEGKPQSNELFILSRNNGTADKSIRAPIAVVERMNVSEKKMAHGSANKHINLFVFKESKHAFHHLDDF